MKKCASSNSNAKMKTKIGTKEGSSNSNENSASVSRRKAAAHNRRKTESRKRGTPKKMPSKKKDETPNKKLKKVDSGRTKPAKKTDRNVKTESMVGSDEHTLAIQQQQTKNKKKAPVKVVPEEKPVKKPSAESGTPKPAEEKQPPKKKQSDNQLNLAKQYFKNLAESRKVIKVVENKNDPIAMDKMPEKLRELKSKEERTARIKKETTACDDEFSKSERRTTKIFDENGHPFWTKVNFDPKEVEKEGIDVEGRVTSEHVLKYLEGTLILQPPPNIAILFDWTKSVKEMEAFDEDFFNEDVVMYHSLRNILNHSERALKRCTSQNNESRRVKIKLDESKSPVVCSVEKGDTDCNIPTVRFLLEKVVKVVYERENPIESIRKCLKK